MMPLWASARSGLASHLLCVLIGALLGSLLSSSDSVSSSEPGRRLVGLVVRYTDGNGESTSNTNYTSSTSVIGGSQEQTSRAAKTGTTPERLFTTPRAKAASAHDSAACALSLPTSAADQRLWRLLPDLLGLTAPMLYDIERDLRRLKLLPGQRGRLPVPNATLGDPLPARTTGPTALSGGEDFEYRKVHAMLKARGLRCTSSESIGCQESHGADAEQLREQLRRGRGLAWLQMAFIRLQNLALKHRFAPLFVTNYGEGRGGSLAPYNEYDKAVLPRFGFRVFFKQNAFRVRRHSTCLCWDDCAVLNHIRQLASACVQQHVFSFDKHRWSDEKKPISVQGGKAALGTKRAMLSGDLVQMADAPLLREAGVQSLYDLILCQEVFEHVAQPFKAARALFHLLKPGGLVFWSAPFLARNHGVPHDYFRYTDAGARQIFVDAGFQIEVMN